MLREELNAEIWTYFEDHVTKAILKYQVDKANTPTQDTRGYVEKVLCEAVQDVERKKASIIITLFTAMFTALYY